MVFRTAPLLPCLPRKKKHISKLGSPETTQKGKGWNMGSSESRLVHCSHLSLLPGILIRMCLPESPEGGQLSREDLCLCAGQPPPTGAKYQHKSISDLECKPHDSRESSWVCLCRVIRWRYGCRYVCGSPEISHCIYSGSDKAEVSHIINKSVKLHADLLPEMFQHFASL